MTPRAGGDPGTCPSCGGSLPHEAIHFCVTCGIPLSEPGLRAGPATAGGPSAGRRRGRRLGAILVVAAVLGLSGGVTAALVSQEHAPARQTAADLRAESAERAQLAGFAPAIRQSIAAHADAMRATRGVARCRMAPAAAINLMYRAIIRRQRALERLSRLTVSAIPGGAEMASDLRDAFRQSIAADQNVIGWMQDVQESRCPVSPRNDLSFQAGLRAAARATAAQRSFLARWNPAARRYRQPTLSPGQL